MRFLPAMALILCATVARAETAFPGAPFGDEEGCRYARTGESSGADTFFLLNESGITTATSFCAITAAEATGASTVALTLSCEAEGEEGGAQEQAEAITESASITVRFADGTVWGPFPRCR